jgi:hypothetical protein
LLYHQNATASTPERVLIQYARRYFTGFLAQRRSANRMESGKGECLLVDVAGTKAQGCGS